VLSLVTAAWLSRESIYTLKLVRRGAHLSRGAGSELLNSTTAAELMETESPIIRPETHFKEALAVVLGNPQYHAFVVGHDGKLRGHVSIEEVKPVLSEADAMTDLIIAADLMVPVPDSVTPTDSLAMCLKALVETGQRELAVLGPENQYLGRIRHGAISSLYQKRVLMGTPEGLDFVSRDPDLDGPHRTAMNLGGGYTVETVPVGPSVAGHSLRELDIRGKHGVQVIGIKDKRTGDLNPTPDPSKPIPRDAELVVIAQKFQIDRFRTFCEPD
jgi:CBS domain-containing protein